MIDIHAHVLPFVDDGSKSVEDSIDLLKEAKNCGVTDIVATPHFKNNFKASKSQILESFNTLMPHAKEIGINLYLGQELKHYSGDLANLLKQEHFTINNSNVVLLEFDSFQEEDISEVAYSFSKKGFVPVIAHVERYPYCLDGFTIEEIKSCGGLIQVNASSVVGKLGKKIKKFVFNLIKYGLVDFIASDIHSFRENDMKKAYDLVSKKFSKEVAEKLFINNQKEYILK